MFPSFFIILHRFFVLTLTVEIFSDSDISRIKVDVSSENILPILVGCGIFTNAVVIQRLIDHIAVIRPLKNRDGIQRAVENINIASAIGDRRRRRKVAELLALIAKSKQQIAFIVIRVNFRPFGIQNRPHAVRPHRNVHKLRGTVGLRIVAHGVEDSFTGRHGKSVPDHDVVALGVQTLDRRISACFCVRLDRRGQQLRLLVIKNDSRPNQALVVKSKVLIRSRYIGFRHNIREKHTADPDGKRNRRFLRAKKALERTVRIERNNTAVCC